MSYEKYTYRQQLIDTLKYLKRSIKLRFKVLTARISCINYDKGDCRFLMNGTRCGHKCNLNQCHRVKSLLDMSKTNKGD